MVVVDKHEFIENFARPNTTGTLVCYDLNTDTITNKFIQKSVSTEVLKFNRTGDLLFARTNSDKSICILNSKSLTVLRSVRHDVGGFPPNHYSYTLFYPFFPLIGRWDSHIAVVQWTGDASIEVTTLPRVQRTLLQLCRLAVLGHMTDVRLLTSQHLPSSLIKYLQWL